MAKSLKPIMIKIESGLDALVAIRLNQKIISAVKRKNRFKRSVNYKNYFCSHLYCERCCSDKIYSSIRELERLQDYENDFCRCKCYESNEEYNRVLLRQAMFRGRGISKRPKKRC